MKFIIFILITWSSINYAQVGIGTINPHEQLEVNGKIRMTDGNESIGKVMTSDANGSATWQDGTGNFSMVSAFANANYSKTTGTTPAWESMTLNAENFDTNSEFDTTNNKFTASITGYYQITAQFTTHNSTNLVTGEYGIAVFKNGSVTPIAEGTFNENPIGIIKRQISKLLFLTAGDYLEFKIQDDGNSLVIDSFVGKTFVTIHRVR